jgi:hypothetical protein
MAYNTKLLWIGGIIAASGAIQWYQTTKQRRQVTDPTTQQVVYDKDWTPNDTTKREREAVGNWNNSAVNLIQSDRFDYDEANPPKTPASSQSATYHLSLTDKHHACGRLYSRIVYVEQNHPIKDKELLQNLEFLYDACIMNQIDSNMYEFYKSKNIVGDRSAEKISEKLLPVNVPYKKTDKQLLNELKSEKDFQILKEGEKKLGKPFHEFLKSLADFSKMKEKNIIYAEEKATK